MAENLIKDYLDGPPKGDEAFVRGALRRVESLHREMALLALSEWQTLEMFLPELHQPLSALVQPAWGHWNRILQELRKARKGLLYKADSELRGRIEGLTVFNHVLDTLAGRIQKDSLESIKPIAEFLNQPAKRVTSERVFEWCIRLRNRIAHDTPEDAQWWAASASALGPFLEWLTKQSWIPEDVSRHTPWFLRVNDVCYHYNGIEGKKAVRYVPVEEGAPLLKEERLQEFAMALATLLGAREKEERDIKRLLEEYTPDEVKGVIMGDFLVGGVIGEGGFSRVHKATHLTTGARVAVKVLKNTSDPEINERFRHEAELLARMNNRHIVSVTAMGNRHTTFRATYR